MVDLGKDKPRVDFEDDFDLLIRQKGFRAWWSRAVMCPCRLNSKTDQADPSCLTCQGDGWFYVCPEEAPSPDLYAEVEGFDNTDTARATQAIVTGMSKNIEIFEKFGEWIMGTVRLSTFSFNKFAYRDKFTVFDGVSEYQQVIPVPASGTISIGKDPREAMRYPVVNLLGAWEITSTGTQTNHKDAVTVNADGSLTIDPAGPAVGTMLAIVYEYHPVLVVMENVLDLRITLRKFKTTAPMGEVLNLPRLVIAKPDFLIS